MCITSLNIHGEKQEKSQIKSIFAVLSTIAGRAGVGNVIGIGLAVFEIGPGVIFWLWIFCFFSMASSFCENTLAQIYKEKDLKEKGIFRGGACYYVLKGLKKNFKWLALTLAVVLFLSKGVFIVSINVNTLDSLTTFAFFHSSQAIIKWVIVAILFVAIALILLGGIHRVIYFSSFLSPIFILSYIGLLFAVIFSNTSIFPGFLGSIFANAFTPLSFLGGAGGFSVGYLIRYGAQRTWFSNEAGQGTSTSVAATPYTDHPVKQGLGQAFSVFIDSIIICTASGFLFGMAIFKWHAGGRDLSHFSEMFLQNHSIAGWNYYGNNNIVIYCFLAMKNLLGYGGAVAFTIILYFFAFFSILYAFLIAEFNGYWFIATVFQKDSLSFERKIVLGLRFLFLLIVAISPFLIVNSLFTLGDFSVAVCYFLNGLAIISLYPVIKVTLRDFDLQFKKFNKNINKTFSFVASKYHLRNCSEWK